MNEIFKDIVGYEGRYQVSNLGNVKSLPNTKRKTTKILTPEMAKGNHTNYYRVTLSKNGERDRQFLHRLVALAFIPNPENKPFINHIDNNGENNRVDNLEWVTHSENMLHAQKQGRLFEAQSKGGKANKLKHYDKVTSEVDLIIGNTFGNLIVKEFHQKEFENNGKYVVKCECERCGTIVNVPFNRLVKGELKQCKGCSLRDASDRKTKELVDKIKNTVIDGWLVSDQYKTVRPNKTAGGHKTSRITFMKCTCANCDFNTVTIKLSSLVSRAYVPRCIVCDNDQTKHNLQDEDMIEPA